MDRGALQIGVVFVIFNNTSYRILKQRLLAQRGYAAQVDTYRRHGAQRSGDRLCRAGAFARLAAERAKTVHDVTDLIARGIKSDAPLLIDVPVDRNYKPV